MKSCGEFTQPILAARFADDYYRSYFGSINAFLYQPVQSNLL
jgi:hypothetical protein